MSSHTKTTFPKRLSKIVLLVLLGTSAITPLGNHALAASNPDKRFNQILSRDFSDPTRKTVVFGNALGETITKSFNVTDTTVTWSENHLYKTTVITYSDNTQRRIRDYVAPKISSTISGDTKKTVKTFGDGTQTTTTETGKLISATLNESGDRKYMTYVFSDGSRNVVEAIGTVRSEFLSKDGRTKTIHYSYTVGKDRIVKLSGTKTSESYSHGNSQKHVVYEFADGTNTTTTILGKPSDPVYDTKNGVTKTITYVFDDGTTNSMTYTGKASDPVYDLDQKATKTVVYSYSDETTKTVTYSGTASDPVYEFTNGVRKIITYSFTDESSKSVEVQGVVTGATFSDDYSKRFQTYSFDDGTTYTATTSGDIVAITYSADRSQQTVKFHYGDSFTSGSQDTVTITVPLLSSSVSWGSDHVTRTTVYTYRYGAPVSISETVGPTDVAPTYTAAKYGGDWSTGQSTTNVTRPATTSYKSVFGDGVTNVIYEDGTAQKPFQQTTLAAAGITDPNAIVKSSTATYNLIWGTPDAKGPGYASLFKENASFISNTPLSWFGHKLSGSCTGWACGFFGSVEFGPKLNKASPETLAALNAGWTGKNTSILMVDSFNLSRAAKSNNYDIIAMTTALGVYQNAPGAALYGLDYFGNDGSTTPDFYTRQIIDLNGTPVSTFDFNRNVNNPNRTGYYANFFDVAILDIYYGYKSDVLPKSFDDARTKREAFANTTSYWAALLGGSDNPNIPVSSYTSLGNTYTPYSARPDFSDAVIVTRAGSQALPIDWTGFAYGLASDPLINPRLLIVGALDKAGSVGANGGPGTASLTSNSNMAGTDPLMQNRFLVASGESVFASGDLLVDGSYVSAPAAITNYAAARVGAYAAVIRQKFPNLTAAQTADILLSTARYDTLSCYPNCDKSIYGMGEASLSRALAPVGRLR